MPSQLSKAKMRIYWLPFSSDVFLSAAMLSIVARLVITRSCKGLSWKTQVLNFAVLVFVNLNLFERASNVADYMVLSQALLVVLSAVVVMTFFAFCKTHEVKEDSFPVERPLIVLLVTSLLFDGEPKWMCALLVDPFVIVPQISMHYKTTKTDYNRSMTYFLFVYASLLTVHKVLYIVAVSEGRPAAYRFEYRRIALAFVQTAVYTVFFSILLNRCGRKTRTPEKEPKIQEKEHSSAKNGELAV